MKAYEILLFPFLLLLHVRQRELRALLRDQLFLASIMLISLERAFQCFGSDACLDSDVLPLKQTLS